MELPALPSLPMDSTPDLSITFKLILCQSFYEFGTKASTATKRVCKTMNEHPLLKEYAGTFTIDYCVQLYESFMNEMGMDPSCPLSPESQPLHDLARKYYLLRVEEIQQAMSTLESQYRTKAQEIEAINQGQFDSQVPSDYEIPKPKLPILPDFSSLELPPLPIGNNFMKEEQIPESEDEEEVVDDGDDYMEA